MKYSVVQCVNGSFSVVSEHSDYESARTSWFGVGRALSNASDVITGRVAVFDENLSCRLLTEDLGHIQPEA